MPRCCPGYLPYLCFPRKFENAREMGESAPRNQIFKPNLKEKGQKMSEKNDASPPTPQMVII
jgi:hypothetical protein